MNAQITMPKSCISCTQFCPKGKDWDPLQQVAHPYLKQTKQGARMPYGTCQQHSVEVYASQLCQHFTADDLITTFPVANRAQPRQPMQLRML